MSITTASQLGSHPFGEMLIPSPFPVVHFINSSALPQDEALLKILTSGLVPYFDLIYLELELPSLGICPNPVPRASRLFFWQIALPPLLRGMLWI